MPTYVRWREAGATYFFTVVTYQTEQSRKQGRRGVWQPRYWEHRIRDEADYLRHRDYIHLNPVKHGQVDRPREWPWSSIHRHIQLGWLDPNWPGSTPLDLPKIDE